jgi:hypothetical protein
VSKFKSLAAELEGHYGKPEHHLPDDLRQRVGRAFAAFYPWNVLSPDQQRDWASRWWRGRAAFQEDAQRDPALDEQDFQSGWDSIAKPEALERQILEWEATSTPTATDLEKKELRLAELRRELADRNARPPGLPTTATAEPRGELAPVVTVPTVRAGLGRPASGQALVKDYIARTYPDGTAATIPDLRRELEAKKIYASTTTIERALGRRRDSDRSSKSRPK